VADQSSFLATLDVGEKHAYDMKTPGSQMGSPAAAEGGGEPMGGGRGESGERSEVQARSSLTSTAPKARSRSREVATRDETHFNIEKASAQEWTNRTVAEHACSKM